LEPTSPATAGARSREPGGTRWWRRH